MDNETKNQTPSPLIQAAVEALNNKTNFEFGASKMASGAIRQTQGDSSQPKMIAEENQEIISEKKWEDIPKKPPRGPVTIDQTTSSGSSGKTVKDIVGASKSKLTAGRVLKGVGKAATPLVGAYGAYQGYKFDPNAPTSRKIRNAAQQAAQYTVDLPRTAGAIAGLGALGAAKLGVPGAEDFAGKSFEWGEKKGWIPDLEKSSSTSAAAAKPATSAPAATKSGRNTRGVQSRIDAGKALDAAAKDRVAGLTPRSMSGVKPPSPVKPLSQMSDEERYGKTGAEIIKVGGMEAYKNRPKGAQSNIDYLKQLQSNKKVGEISASATARAKQTPLSIPEPKMTAADSSVLQQVKPAVDLKPLGAGVFRSSTTGEKTGLRKAIPNELAAIFSPRTRTELKQNKIDSLQPMTVTAKKKLGEQSDAMANELLGFEAAKNARVQGREKIIGALKSKQKPLPLPPSKVKKPSGDYTIQPVLPRTPSKKPTLGRTKPAKSVGGALPSIPSVPGTNMQFKESTTLLEQYIEQLHYDLVEQYGEENAAELVIESIIDNFNEQELTNEEFVSLNEESEKFAAEMEALSEEEIDSYFSNLNEEQVVYAIQLASLNEGLLKKIGKALKKVAKVALPVAAGFLLPGIGGAIAGKVGAALGKTAIGKAVSGVASKVGSNLIGKTLVGAAKNAISSGALNKLQGGSFSQGAKAGAIGNVAGQIGGALGGKIAQATGSATAGDIAGNALAGGLQTKALGGSFGAGAQYGATGAVQNKVFTDIEDRMAAAAERRKAQQALAKNITAPTTLAKVAEESKLDPVGREDADVNNDGKEDKTDVYLAKKREKIGSAIAKRLGKPK